MKYNWLACLFLTISLASISAVAETASKKSVKMLMERTGAGNMGVQMMNQMLPALKKMVPDAPEKFWTDVMAEMNANQIIELVIPVYQKHLTEQDIKEIIAFYNSAAGKKLIRVQPAIMQESMALGQQWGQETARNVINKYKAQSEKNHNKTLNRIGAKNAPSRLTQRSACRKIDKTLI
ncbi:MAG: DUF2059 domain-containing protein [Gammaproteobacteria bacterium]|nr:DUF2059 domain-containing protein [Gammaproteobacteria bacterium]